MEKDHVYSDVRKINAMESLKYASKVLTVSCIKLAVIHVSEFGLETHALLIGPKPILNCQQNRAFHIALG